MQSGHKTRVLSRALIASETGLSANTVKVTLARMIATNVISRGHFSRSSTAGGAVYFPSKCVREWCDLRNANDDECSENCENIGVSTRVQNLEDSGTNRDVSSSSLNNNNKQTVSGQKSNRALQQSLEPLKARLDFDSFGLGFNDLIPIVRDWDGPVAEFLEALEHIVFYLRSTEAAGIRNPKAWLLKQLRAGYYGMPAGFVSWDVRQAEEKLRSRQKQAEQRKQLRLKEHQADFDLWLADLDATSRKKIFADAGMTDLLFVTPRMQTDLLRSHFAQINAIPEFASEGSADETL